ncbi:MAG: substrate-binding domain-containing protein [Proteobacteria bacterium]|nr:substrate-binding domain-containing protein [Pseudomonadota bacterium]MBU1739756.1 substrate-binding domain-containing protein [Pseudomonadota bacterium]
MNRTVLKFFVFILGLLLTSISTVSAQEVQFWGSTTCQKRFLEPGAEALEKATGIKTKVFGVGTGKGMLALFEGKTNVAISSNTLEESVQSAQKVLKKDGKPPIEVPKNLQFHEITMDLIVPIANAENPVSSLSWAQLADLNTGKVTNWKDVGGPDLPVQVITSHAGSSTKAVFQSMVMKKADYAANAILVQSTRLEINEVSKNKGGIGAVSSGFFNLNPGNAKIIKTDTIQRPLGLITIGDPAPEVQKVIDFYRSPEGQKQILD